MPQSGPDLVDRFFRTLEEGDADEATRFITDDAVIDRRNSDAPWGRTATRGKQEFVQAFRGFELQWRELGGVRWEMLDKRPMAGGRIVIETRISGRGPTTGLDMDARAGWLLAFERGLISRCTLFQTVAEAELAARRLAFEEARLYFVCDARPGGRDPAPLLEAALRGGADVIQLRDKTLSDERVAEAAAPFRAAARAHGALFVLNDRPDLVAAARADGVHVGQDDTPVADARRLAGAGAVVGLSTHAPAEVDAAFAAEGEARPDQISVGPVWETPTKEGRPATGLGLISHAASAGGDIPWFAIGGIDRTNVGDVVAAGARRIVVVRAIRDADDPEAAARELRAALD